MNLLKIKLLISSIIKYMTRLLIIIFVLFYTGSAFLLMLKKDIRAEKLCNLAFAFLIAGIVLEIVKGFKKDE